MNTASTLGKIYSSSELQKFLKIHCAHFGVKQFQLQISGVHVRGEVRAAVRGARVATGPVQLPVGRGGEQGREQGGGHRHQEPPRPGVRQKRQVHRQVRVRFRPLVLFVLRMAIKACIRGK